MKRHTSWKRWAGHLLRVFSTYGDRRVILIYHAVGSGPLSLPEQSFREHMNWLAENARVISIDNLLEGEGSTGLQVALTFDDGYESLYRTAAPILERAGLVAAAYLNTTCIGDCQRVASDPSKGHYPGEQFLLWEEVVALRGLGWIIGSHGADHVDLTRLPDAEAHVQLKQSKAAVEERLGTGCNHFAYPWGHHNSRVRGAVAQCGYRWAAAGVHGAVFAGCDRYAIPRIDIRKDYELEDFIAVVRGDWDYLRFVQSARQFLR